MDFLGGMTHTEIIPRLISIGICEMDKQPMVAQKVKSKGSYSKVIQVNAPVRFFWIDGTFDGIEIGPVPDDTTRYQRSLIIDAVKAISFAMGQTVTFDEDKDAEEV